MGRLSPPPRALERQRLNIFLQIFQWIVPFLFVRGEQSVYPPGRLRRLIALLWSCLSQTEAAPVIHYISSVALFTDKIPETT